MIISRESNDKYSRIAKKYLTLMASLLSAGVITVQVTVYIPSTADVYHKVETQNICVKELISSPPDAHEEWASVKLS